MTPDPTTRVPLGRTKLSVSRICFGLAPIGDMPDTYGYGVSAEQGRAVVRAIFDGPTNFLDTSRNYGFGRSEERVGEVIRERGGLPGGFVISTKLDRDMETNRFDRSRARRSLEESLKTLGVDRIQLLHVHDPEYASSLADVTGAEGAISELFRMKEEGLVEAVGLAAGKVDIMMPILRNWNFDALMTHNRFTLLNRNASKMIDYANDHGIAVLNAAPYASGILAKGSAAQGRYVYQEASGETISQVSRVEDVCRRHGIPPGAAALQFSMRDERITSTACGISKPERIAQTLDWARYDIPAAAWTELMELPYESEDPEASRVYKPG